MVSQCLQNACRDFEDMLHDRPREDYSDSALKDSLEELVKKDTPWEKLDEAHIASSAPLLLGQSGLLEYVKQLFQEKEHTRTQCRKFALDVCAKFLRLYGRGAIATLQRRFAEIVLACMQIFRRDGGNQVQAAGLSLLLQVLETPGCPSPAMDLGEELLRDLKMKHSKMIASQTSVILKILAALANRVACDVVSGLEYNGFVKELPLRFLGILERETAGGKKPSLDVLAGVIEALRVLLDKHVALFSDGDMHTLYIQVSVIALDESDAQKFAPQRSALRFLQHHAIMLRKFYVEDALKIRNCMKEKGNENSNGELLDKLISVTRAGNKDVALSGRAALDAILRALSACVPGTSPSGMCTDIPSSSVQRLPLEHKTIDNVRPKSLKRPLDSESSLFTKLEAGDVTLDSKDAAMIDSALSLKRQHEEDDLVEAPKEALFIRRWYEYFRKLVLNYASDEDEEGNRRRDVILGVRSLGALAPAILQFDGAPSALDALEVVLDAFEVAMRSEGGGDPEGTGIPANKMASSLPEYVEALARMIPVVQRWLTPSQWSRVISIGGSLLNKFGDAFLSHHSTFANSFTSLLRALGSLAQNATAIDHSSDSCSTLFDALVAHGVVITVITDPSLQELWELVFLNLENGDEVDIEQKLVESIVASVLQLARQGVDEHFRVHRQEERHMQQTADHIAKAKARGAIASLGKVVASAASPLQEELQQAVAEADPTFAIHTTYILTQAMFTAEYMNQLVTMFDKLFGRVGTHRRKQMLRPWVENIICCVADAITPGQNAGSPPPGIFRLLRIALSACSETPDLPDSKLGDGVHKMLLGFLEDVAGAVQGYHGIVATEALEALLAARPEWINTERWLPIFRRALSDGIYDVRLAQHALHALERWRDNGAEVQWSAILPCFAPYLHEREFASRGGDKKWAQATRRAKKAIKAMKDGQGSLGFQDRAAFLRRLLGFIGSLGGGCHALVQEPAPHDLQRPTAALGLRIPLAMGGIIAELEPALLLPHLAQVIKRNPQKRLRLAAAEGLHAILRYVIGSDSIQNSEASVGEHVEVPTDFAEALRSPLLPLALIAAADEDTRISQLFKVLLSQHIAWFAKNPPTASLSSMRDALLEAMSDPENSNLRSTAARYYHELLRAHEDRPGDAGAVVAKRLLQHLLAAASHVDRFTQLSALQSLLWCALSWHSDSKCTPAVLHTLKVVVHCLQTSNMDSQGLPVETAAMQLGRRLLRLLPKADASTDSFALRDLQMKFWQGAGSLEPAARGFCREALQQLLTNKIDKVPSKDALDALLSNSTEKINWPNLEVFEKASTHMDSSPKVKTPKEAAVIARSLDALTALVDTELWLSLSDGGGCFFSKTDFARVGLVSSKLICRAVASSSILIPWGDEGTNSDALSMYLLQYAPKDRERLMAARIGALVALVSYLSLSSCHVGSRMMDILLTMVLSPATLLADVTAWKSSMVQRHVIGKAVAAIRRVHGSIASLQTVVRAWLERHPDMDFAKYANRDAGCHSFEACFRQWSELRRGDVRGMAERMSAYVHGLEELQQQFLDEPGMIWKCFFESWPGGIQAMLSDWTKSVAWYAGEKKGAASHHMVQSFVRFLLIVVPSQGNQIKSSSWLQDPVNKVAMIEAFLTLPRPPKETLGKLLSFFSENSWVLFEHSKPWASMRKRGLLMWLCDFAAFARETQADKDQLDDDAKKATAEHNSWNDDDGETCSQVLGSNFILRGSVLTHVASSVEKSVGTSQDDSNRRKHSFEFAELFAQLPKWYEWAVSDAMHGGADDEDAPVLPPPVKRIKSENSKDGISRRVRQSRSDRTGLYQLASLLRASAAIQPVLTRIANDPEVCRFLVGVAKGVLDGEAAPRMKALFLTAIPALLFLCEARQAATSQAGASQCLAVATEQLQEIVCGLVRSHFPLRSHEYARESEEYGTYFVLLDGLFRALEQSAPSVRLLPALYGTLKERNHREEAKIRSFVRRFVRYLADGIGANRTPSSQQVSATGGVMAGSFEAIFTLFLDAKLDDRKDDNIRFALMEKLALPLLWELTSSPSGCVEFWLTYWPRLLELANTEKVLSSISLNDTLALELKIQELTCIYGAIEVLFIRTPPEVLRERIAPRLPKINGQPNTPSRDLILFAKKAIGEPIPGAERLGTSTLRKFKIRAYSALSAATCAGQAIKELYVTFLFKETYWDDLIESWGTKFVDMSALSPSTNFTHFSRSGYSFAFLSAPDPQRRMRSRDTDMPVGSQVANPTLLGANLWGATIGGLGSLPGEDLSLQKTVIKRAVVTKAALSLTQVAPAHHKTLAATVARATQGTATLDVGQEETWSAPPPGAEGAASRLRAALMGRRPRQSFDIKDGDVEMVRWDVESLELDAQLFPGGPTQESNLALFLTLLRTFDVMDERFGSDMINGPIWLSPFLLQAEKPTTDFWFRLIFLRLLILRADVLRAQLFGQHARLFRFVVGLLLDPRFGAEKKLHYFFRDALQRLIVPQLGSSSAKEEEAVTIKPPLAECAYEAQRLLHHLQRVAPHNESWWQKVHIGLVRAYIEHYASGAGSVHAGLRSLEPDSITLGRQLSAKGSHASIMQHSALRQMASFLEFGGFDPFKEDYDMVSQSPIPQWRTGLLACICSPEDKLAAYSCGIVGLIAKWNPQPATSLIEECCLQIESQRNKQEKMGGYRMALCFEQLVTMCPWALCDLQPAGALGAPLGGSVRRRLITRQISSLQSQTLVLRSVLAGFSAICQDYMTNASQAAAPGAWAQQATSSLESFGRRRQPPPRPGGEALRLAQKELQNELLMNMKSGEVWRRALLSGDKPLQSVAAKLVRIVAPVLDEDTLFSCTGLMLETFEAMKKQQEVEKQHRDEFTDELLAVCFVVCDRRPDVARGEVAQQILAFLFEAVVHTDSEELREKAFNFWETQLSVDASPRLFQLCTMLSSLENMQANFVPGALQLLLRLARKAVEFRRTLLRKPLADCEFKPMQFSTSSWIGSQRLRTFQPASTFASAFRSLAASLSQVHFEKGPRRPSSTTRQIDAASVQQSLSADAVTPVLVHKRHRFPAATSSTKAQVDKSSFPEVPALLRHNEKFAANAAIRWNERQTKLALASLVKVEEEGEDEADIDLIRNYRIGEFPDVLVTVEDILEPLLKVASDDRALGEELLLTVWSAITGTGSASSEALAGGNASMGAPAVSIRSTTSLDRTNSHNPNSSLQNAIALLFEKGDSDETFSHFLHRLLMRCGRENCASLQLPVIQKTLRVSRLSGVQALEELLPDLGFGILPQQTTSASESGRHRTQLSALYEAYAELREGPCMEAALAQLRTTSSFTSITPQALAHFHEGDVERSAEEFAKVLDGSDAALPAWEVHMASSARISALESLMSWDKLGGVLQDSASALDADTLRVQTVRAELGKSIMPREFWNEKVGAIKKTMPELEFKEFQKRSCSFLDASLQHNNSHGETFARGAALLAIHAASQGRQDDVQRLVIQGYDSFAATWQRIPRLAASAKHELLSSLPLLHTLELFAKDLPVPKARPLDKQHDAFVSWIDISLAKVAVGSRGDDSRFAADALADLGRYCRKVKNFATASKLLTCCANTTHKEFKLKFVSEIIKLKLGQRETPCVKLSEVVEREMGKHSDPGKLPYKLLLAEVASEGYKRKQNDQTAIWKILRSARDIADECEPADRSPAYAKLAEFADGALREMEHSREALLTSPLQGEQRELAITVVECVLKVLENGEMTCSTRSKAFRQAHDKLPRVFELLASMPHCRETFLKFSSKMPQWVVLRWLPQALAHLPTVPVLLDTLQNVAKRFPQAMIWPLQLASKQDDSSQRSRALEPLWNEVKQSHAPVQLALDLTRGWQLLTHPDMRFKDELKPFAQAVQRGDYSLAKSCWKTLYKSFTTIDSKIHGKVHKDFAERLLHFLKDISKRGHLSNTGPELLDKDMNVSTQKAWLQVIKGFESHIINPFAAQAKQSLGRKDNLELYSSFLAAFDARAAWHGSVHEWLEVPGQYSGLERPDIRAHVRILRFTPQVLVMSSKQRPKRLIILGSDEKEHWFLVKGGEDVRLDARVEQLFESINGLVSRFGVPGLRIQTVAVVPLLPDLGLIQWARDTRTMKSVVLESAGAKDLMDIKAHKDRVEWAKLFGPGLPQQRYEAIFKAEKDNVIVAYSRDAAKMTSSATLRNYLWNSALGPEAFWHLRQRFAASLAASSAACYILGIGDRHLDNFLLNVKLAEIVPIDFGYSFGVGALLPVPEMLPFRLTNFFLSVLQPLAGNRIHGVFRDGLEKALTECRENAGALMDACRIFLHEPLLDWSAEAKRRGEQIDFLPRRRLNCLEGRLQGKHPAKVLLDEIGDSTLPWVKKLLQDPDKPLVKIAAGIEDDDRARLYEKEHLTVKEQVDCLIRQATDMNILGRAWEGWAPEL